MAWLRPLLAIVPVSFAGALACAPEAEHPRPPPAVPTQTAEGAEPIPSAPAIGDVPGVVSAVPHSFPFVGYLNVEELMKRPSADGVRAIVANLKEARQGLALAKTMCGIDLVTDLKHAVLATNVSYDGRRLDADPRHVFIGLELGMPAERIVECVGRLVPARPLDPPESGLELPGGQVLRASESTLSFGDPEASLDASRRLRAGAAPTGLVLELLQRSPGATAWVTGNGVNPFGLEDLSAVLTQNEAGTTLDGKVRLADSAKAQAAHDHVQAQLLQTEHVFKQLLERSAGGKPPPSDANVFKKGVLAHKGDQLTYSLSLTREESERFFSTTLVGIVQVLTAQYSAGPIAAEARDNVMRIALLLADHARAHKKKPRFPASAPATPAKIPGEAPANDVSFEHPSWKAIGFSLRQPTHFSYEFVTAADGERVRVRARRDADGDGIEATFEVDVEIRGGEPTVADKIKQDNVGE